jgi:hypothetical protein
MVYAEIPLDMPFSSMIHIKKAEVKPLDQLARYEQAGVRLNSRD